MLIAVTVTGNEGKAQYIEAVVRMVFDDTQSKNAQLKSPIRIRINKSPVITHYGLYQVGYVNHEPYEEMSPKKGKSCRDDWYSTDSESACGFVYEKGERIFDSQGFCCSCAVGGNKYYRGSDKKCQLPNGLKSGSSGHCLKFSPLYHYVFGLYPPQLMFDITVTIEQANSNNTWSPVVEDLKIGPQRTIMKSANYSVNVQYIADFYSSSFEPSLANKFLLIPDLDKLKGATKAWLNGAQQSGLLDSLKNASERLLVPKEYTDFTGFSCDRIGVHYTAFRNQNSKCSQHYGSCLRNQPASLWTEDKMRQSKGQRGTYMAHNYGKVYSVPDSKGVPRFELNFVAQSNKVSLIAITMEADSIKSSGRIVEAHINTFQALSSEGLLFAVIQNTGHLTATYHVSVAECSAGIDMITAQVKTLNPLGIANFTFQVHSFFSVGQINRCIVELYDNGAEMLDNLTVQFQTEDTCFCYGHCGCACGSNRTDCPPPPTYLKPANYSNFGISVRGLTGAFEKVGKWFKDTFDSGTLGTTIVVAIIVLLVIGLGALKVVLVVYTGKLNLPAVPCCTRCICGVAGALGECLKICLQNLKLDFLFCCTRCLPGDKGFTAAGAQAGGGWIRPAYCNGTCEGAGRARREHRRLLRMHKRRSLPTPPPEVWWESPYTCTCAVRSQKNCGGRYRRRRQYQTQHAAKVERSYLVLDKYMRGKVETVGFDGALKKRRKEITEGAGEAMTAETTSAQNDDLDTSSEEAELNHSDTSDENDATDVSELLAVGDPVYFNYSGITPTSAPTSLKNPGANFSIKGKLAALEESSYSFELGKYNSQVTRVIKGVPRTLRSPHVLMGVQFEKHMDRETATKLVTLHPLYICLNDT
ncbi:hypothetical protein EMCRGX_G032572 [Ephydatia muelleri]